MEKGTLIRPVPSSERRIRISPLDRQWRGPSQTDGVPGQESWDPVCCGRKSGRSPVVWAVPSPLGGTRNPQGFWAKPCHAMLCRATGKCPAVKRFSPSRVEASNMACERVPFAPSLPPWSGWNGGWPTCSRRVRVARFHATVERTSTSTAQVLVQR
jgi:hypothetical protein